MPYNRPGAKVYITNGGTPITHNTPQVAPTGHVGIATKQVAPDPTAALSTQYTIAAGEQYVMVVKGVVEVPFVTGVAKGDPVYITAATGVLSETASGNVKFGRCTEIQGQRGTGTGFMRIDLDAKDSF